MRATGGLAGADMRLLQKTDRKIKIVGIDDHELAGLDVATAAALFDTQKGPVIGIFHEHTHNAKGRYIHAAGQMEWLNCKVHDISKVTGGAQRIETPDYDCALLNITTLPALNGKTPNQTPAGQVPDISDSYISHFGSQFSTR